MGFAGLRVLELGSLASASWCARLFADFGADVLKLEPDGGDPLRAASPLFEGPRGRESAAFAFLNNLKLFHLAVSLGGNEESITR